MNHPIETWLNSVSYSHSQSKATEYQYKRAMQQFVNFIKTTPKKILTEYENSDEKTFKRKYSQKLQEWIAELSNEKLASTSIRTKVGAIKSFFKYSNLPLGYIPQAKVRITYHNRDIEANEIAHIMALSKPREQAFYIVMAQSGQRPVTLKQLKLEDLEDLNNEQGSYKINISEEIEKGKFGRHPAFIGKAAKKYLKLYLAERTNLKPESLLFSTKKEQPINTKNISREFQRIAQKLQKTGQMNYKINQKGKPSEIRLYTLRKFFRKYANQMGFEHVNHLMGHTTKGSDSNYTPKDDEFYRKLYEVNALPFLEIESPQPTDTFKLKEQYRQEIEKRDSQIQNLQEQINRIEKALAPRQRKITWEEAKEEIDKQIERDKKHPKEAKSILESERQDDEKREELRKLSKDRLVDIAFGLKRKLENVEYATKTKNETKQPTNHDVPQADDT